MGTLLLAATGFGDKMSLGLQRECPSSERVLTRGYREGYCECRLGIAQDRVQWSALLTAVLKRRVLQRSKLVGLLRVMCALGRKYSCLIYYPIPR